MEHEFDLLPSAASLLRLPENYSKGIFECLQIDDTINLVESCGHYQNIADDHILTKYSKFEINQSNYRGIEYISPYIGCYVTSLTIDCGKLDPNWSLGRILADFTNVKCLRVRIANCPDESHRIDLSLCNFDRVESLTLAYCNVNFAKSFLKNFHQLKCLKILTTSFRPDDLRSVFRSNPAIASFIFCCSGRGRDFTFDYRLLQLLAKVRRLSISVSDDLNMNALTDLHQLTKVHINCQWLSINDTLRLLTRNGILEDIQLLNAHTDDDLFDILKLFDKLQSLVITTDNSSAPDSTMPWPANWPSKLKILRLAGSSIVRKDFLATIKQLKLLEVIDIGRSDIPGYDKNNSEDAMILAGEAADDEILGVIKDSDRQRLDVILPADSNCKTKVSEISRGRRESSNGEVLFFFFLSIFSMAEIHRQHKTTSDFVPVCRKQSMGLSRRLLRLDILFIIN